jgi:hypothetical protein
MNMMKITIKRILGIIGLLMAIGFGVFVYGGWQMFGDELKAIKSIKMIQDEKITAYSVETAGTFDLESELALISYYLILNLHR